MKANLRSRASLRDCFPQGSRVYLRHVHEGQTIVLPLVSGSPSQLESVLELVWDSQEPSPLSALASQQEVCCHAIDDNMMRSVRARVLSLGGGRASRMLVKVEQSLQTLPFRVHPRYQVQGECRVSALGNSAVLAENSGAIFNISLGGFGFHAAPLDAVTGQIFAFTIDARHAGQQYMPPLHISGQAFLQESTLQAGPLVYIGFDFDGLAMDQQEQLEQWVSEHLMLVQDKHMR